MTVAAAAQEPRIETWKWWEARRLRYNLGLAVAGWLAWGAQAAAIWTLGPMADLGADGPEVTAFSIAFQGIAYLVVMGAANVCYLLGPITEALVRPAEPERFRRATFAMGFWGSCALPFLFPVLVTLGLLQAITRA